MSSMTTREWIITACAVAFALAFVISFVVRRVVESRWLREGWKLADEGDQLWTRRQLIERRLARWDVCSPQEQAELRAELAGFLWALDALDGRRAVWLARKP